MAVVVGYVLEWLDAGLKHIFEEEMIVTHHLV